jgi:polo-like kinase 1
MLWVIKWLDYSDKYGFGYQLSDDSIGISFNDGTKMIQLAESQSIHYIEFDGKESYYISEEEMPPEHNKKIRLLNYFVKYMKENLARAMQDKWSPSEPGCIARLPHLWTWFRSATSVVMILTNGTIQINKLRTHVKIVICPLLGAISIISPDKTIRTFRLSAFKEAISNEMLEILKDVQVRLELLFTRALENEGPLARGGSNDCKQEKSATVAGPRCDPSTTSIKVET